MQPSKLFSFSAYGVTIYALTVPNLVPGTPALPAFSSLPVPLPAVNLPGVGGVAGNLPAVGGIAGNLPSTSGLPIPALPNLPSTSGLPIPALPNLPSTSGLPIPPLPNLPSTSGLPALGDLTGNLPTSGLPLPALPTSSLPLPNLPSTSSLPLPALSTSDPTAALNNVNEAIQLLQVVAALLLKVPIPGVGEIGLGSSLIPTLLGTVQALLQVRGL